MEVGEGQSVFLTTSPRLRECPLTTQSGHWNADNFSPIGDEI
jgi:hypothetical protein